jgi:Fe-S oxidoreductase
MSEESKEDQNSKRMKASWEQETKAAADLIITAKPSATTNISGGGQRRGDNDCQRDEQKEQPGKAGEKRRNTELQVHDNTVTFRKKLTAPRM